MLRLAHPEYLWLLLGLLPAVLLYATKHYWRKKKARQFGKVELVRALTPTYNIKRQHLKFTLFSLAYIFAVLGAANPQIGSRTEKVKRSGIDVIIALDVSKSMLAEDVKPNRLLRSKNFISNFIEKLSNDRLGMIVFAGKAYMQMPLTVDYSAARMYLKSINTNMVPTQGTAIAEAIDLANRSFVKGETKHKALIIISDGEDNEGDVDGAIARAKKEGIRIFTIGVGSETGAPIPVYQGGAQVDYKRDKDNNIVLTKLNPEMLREIAAGGNGKFFALRSGNEMISDILRELGKMESKDFDEVVFTDYDDQFQWFLGIAFILLLVEWWLSERRQKFFMNIKNRMA